MPTREEIRKAAIEAVAKRIADQHQQQKDAAPAAPPVQTTPAQTEPAPKPVDIHPDNGFITVNASATLTFGQVHNDHAFVAPGSISFKRLEQGETKDGMVEWRIPVKWKYPQIQEKNSSVAQVVEGSGVAYIVVPFTINTDKPDQPAMVWHIPSVVDVKTTGGGATLTVPTPPVSTEVAGDKGTVSITPTIQFQEQVALADNKAGDTASVGITVPILGGVGVQGTHDVGHGHQEQIQVNITKAYTLSFSAEVTVPAKPDPVPLPQAQPLVVLFAVNSDATAQDEGIIADWYKKLDKKLKDSIEAGKTPINILGKASTTGSLEYNRRLAHRRADKVKEILADLAGTDAKFHVQAPGKSEAKGPGENQEDRVVEVTVGDDRPPTS